MSEWRVYVSRFPVGPPTEVLGTVKANGRRSAELKAELKFKSTRLVVEPLIANDEEGEG